MVLVASTGNRPVVCAGYNYYDGNNEQCYFYDMANNNWENPYTLSEARDEYVLGQLNNDDFWIIGE